LSFPKEWEQIKKSAFEVFKERIESRASEWCDIKGGAETGAAYRACREAFSKFSLRMNTIHSVTSPQTEVKVLGKRISTPTMIAPLAQTILQLKPDGFLDFAKATGKIDSITWIGFPNKREVIQAIASQKLSPLIYIVKPLKDRNKIIDEFKFAKELGVHAVGIDIDSSAGLKTVGDESRFAEMSFPISPTELGKIRKSTDLPLIVKGILDKKDAAAAVRAGVDAIVVSNHSGFALDYSKPSILALADVKSVVKDRAEIYLDSGVRRGTDILKALALGARAVLIGSLPLWGLAIGGSEGVVHMFQMLTNELKRAMILTGVQKAERVPPDILTSV